MTGCLCGIALSNMYRQALLVPVGLDSFKLLHARYWSCMLPHPDSPPPCRWFHFRVSGASQCRNLRLHIINAGASSFPDAWNGYQTCASYNLKDWFRVSTGYDKASGVLTFEHTVKPGMVSFRLTPHQLDLGQSTDMTVLKDQRRFLLLRPLRTSASCTPFDAEHAVSCCCCM